MEFFWSSFNAVLVIILLYISAIYARYKEFVKEEHSLVLVKLVTELCLPAMIFVTVAGVEFNLKKLEPAFVMFGLEVGCIALAWWVSGLLKLSMAQKGAVVLCSAFGSSTFLGYAFIMEIFPGQPGALDEAVLISEVGVGYPIFILGPILASKFGDSQKGNKCSHLNVAKDFFKSPVFFSLMIGIFWSVMGLPGGENPVVAPFFKFFNVLSSALTPLAVLSVGLMFKVPKIKSILIPVVVVILIKLILKPAAANFISAGLGFPDLWREVLVILAAMPPAMMGVVFLKRYGADAALASSIVLSVTIVSALTLTLVALLI